VLLLKYKKPSTLTVGNVRLHVKLCAVNAVDVALRQRSKTKR